MPSNAAGCLSALTVRVLRKAGELKAALPSSHVRSEIARLVCQMNSYYSNLIEGHKTLPGDIERALKQGFSEDAKDRRNQELSVAHIRVEQALRDRLHRNPSTDVFSCDFICWIHREFYSHLPKAEWMTSSREGTHYPLDPGEMRQYNVDVGRHVPPAFETLQGFMQRFHEFYGSERIAATDRLIALSAAHHRLTWIHPFGDGNGRVARLHSQAAMIAAGLDGEGLWTLSRGLARRKSDYYAHLQSADQPRAGDLDGRGNLSDKALAEFCRFFLEQIADQIEFMIGLISPFHLIDRIESYIQLTRVDLKKSLRNHLRRLLKALCLEGDIARGAVPSILGLKSTSARDVVRRALSEELIQSPSPKGPLRIAFPNKVVDSYFPQLFTDLPTDR